MTFCLTKYDVKKEKNYIIHESTDYKELEDMQEVLEEFEDPFGLYEIVEKEIL